MSTQDYINGPFRDYIAAEAGDEVADSACRMLHGFVDGLRREVRAELQPQLDAIQAQQDAAWSSMHQTGLALVSAQPHLQSAGAYQRLTSDRMIDAQFALERVARDAAAAV